MPNTLWNPYQQKVPQPLIWQDRKFEYDANDNPIYIGQSVLHDPSTSTGNNWWILKITYDASDNITKVEGPIAGNWDSRTTLDWSV